MIKKVKSVVELYVKMIELMEVLVLHKDMAIGTRQKEFIATNLYIKKTKKYSVESLNMGKSICELMGIEMKDVYNYRKVLKDKNWLIQTTEGLELPHFINSLPLTKTVDFKCKIQVE